MNAPSRGLGVLIVDDDPDMRWALDRLLRKDVFSRVNQAGSGLEALALVKKNVFDLLIVDVKLPDMDGIGLTQRMRDEALNAAPVLLLSGYLYGDDELVRKNIASGLVAAFLAKPFGHAELLELIQRMLTGKKLSNAER